MATIDIGKIKPVFKGTYDNSTAYVLDDIVYYNGSSYVAKTSTTGNLPTDTTKWNILASGSGGIWDSTLSIGSAGQSVKVNSGGTALEFGTISSDCVKIAEFSHTSGLVTNIDMDNIFSATYPFYKVIFHDVLHNGTGAQGWVRAIKNDGTISSSNTYEYALNGRSSDSSDTSSQSAPNSYLMLSNDLSSDTEKTSSFIINVFQPYQTSAYKWFAFHNATYCNNSSGLRYFVGGGAWKNTSTQMRGLRYLGQGTSNIIKRFKAVVYGFKGAY